MTECLMQLLEQGPLRLLAQIRGGATTAQEADLSDRMLFEYLMLIENTVASYEPLDVVVVATHDEELPQAFFADVLRDRAWILTALRNVDEPGTRIGAEEGQTQRATARC